MISKFSKLYFEKEKTSSKYQFATLKGVLMAVVDLEGL